MTNATDSVEVHLLADHESLIAAVGEIQWREWGHPPEPEDRDWWIDVSAREAGRRLLPITWVAIDARGEAVGAAGLGEFDIEERRDRSPWVLGMIVRPDRRGTGIGRRLLSRLESWAREQGCGQVWVATGDQASGFYQACGWQLIERFERGTGETAVVLSKHL
jgi:GNAT superfamily N-acetyltransferase